MIGRARLRLTAWYAGIFIATLLALGASAYWMLRSSLDDEVDRGVETVVEAWLTTVPSDLSALGTIDIDRDYEGETADVFLLVFRADGALVANPNRVEAEEFVDEGLVRAALHGQSVWATLREHGTQMRVLAAPIIADGRIAGAVIGGRSLEAHDRQLERLLWILGAAGAAGLVMAGAGGYVVAGRALRPISIAYERQRTFVGDASHELRSPLAVIRASSELLLREPMSEPHREAIQEIQDTTVEATALVEDLLLLARLDRGDIARPSKACDAAVVVDDVLGQLDSLIQQHGSTVTRSGTDVQVWCPASDLRRILRALIENVLAHTPPGTTFEVTTGSVDAHGMLIIRDHGPGVPPASLSTLMDPFTRVSTARTPTEGSSGLGLAIAHRLVSRSGGTLEVRNHPAGGLEMAVRLRRMG